MLLFKRWVVRAFLCSFAWDGMLVFDMVSFSILRARCHNHNTSSISQVVDILRLLRDVGSGDVSIWTCHCHLLLFLAHMVVASKMCLVRCAQRVMMFVGVLHSLSVWFSHVALCEGECSARGATRYGSQVTKTLAHNSCSGEFFLGATRRLPMCGAHWSASCVNLTCVLWLLRDVGGGDMPMRTCHYHLLLLFTNGFASKMCWVRGV